MSGTARPSTRASAAALLVLSLGVCASAVAPLRAAVLLSIVFAWAAMPGVLMVLRLNRSPHNAWVPAVLAGPLWGFGLTSLVLMALWLADIRWVLVLALAPLVATLLAIPCRRSASSLTLPDFDRRDCVPVVLVLALVPLVDGRPFARVGEARPEGKAYRAYFIADFEWEMAVVAELSKGDVPPHNPFLAGDRLHYYWLTNLLSAIEYRTVRDRLTMESILLINTLLIDLGFVAFLYVFVRHFVHSPPAAALGVIMVVLFSSFEGTQQLYWVWHQRLPLAYLRALNIDAISNWTFHSLKVDGLHRLLLYQPQHATAWAISLSGLLVLLASRDNARFGVNLLAGTLVATSLLVSSFIALMVGTVVALYQLVTLALRARWRALVIAGVAGGLPVSLAVLVSSWLQYVDRSGGPIVYVGHLNPVAATHPAIGIFLSFGPPLIAATCGLAIAFWRRAVQFGALALIAAVAWFFYFFVDVVDHQHAYVGWRAGHLLFIAFAPCVGFAWQELSAAGRGARAAAIGVGLLLAVTAAPTTLIDMYNTQDTSFQAQGPGFKWTEILTPDELQALAWVRACTPPAALVQVDPVRESGTWAYMPAFGQRRMVAGMPISMIPLQKYAAASARVRRVFVATDALSAYQDAAQLKLQYLYIGPREQKAYPRLSALLANTASGFTPVFRNASVTIYSVTREAQRNSRCRCPRRARPTVSKRALQSPDRSGNVHPLRLGRRRRATPTLIWYLC